MKRQQCLQVAIFRPCRPSGKVAWGEEPETENWFLSSFNWALISEKSCLDTLAKSISSVEARWRFLGRGSFLLAFGLGFIGNHRDCNIMDFEHGEHLFFKFRIILARTRGSKGPEYIIDQRFLHAVNMYIMKNIISLVLKKLRGGGINWVLSSNFKKALYRCGTMAKVERYFKWHGKMVARW